MKHCLTTLLIFAFVSSLVQAVPAPKEKSQVPKGVRIVEMPGKKLSIRHANGPDGPVVRIDVDGNTVEGKRIFIGDGREAMELVADEKWVRVLDQDGAKIMFSVTGCSMMNGAIEMKRGKVHPFGRMREGDIYIINSPIKLELRDDKRK
jgi:hypothetical protein